MNEICSVCGCELRCSEDTACSEYFYWTNCWNTPTTDEKRIEQAAMEAYPQEGDRP
jgi:hypothetical protein